MCSYVTEVASVSGTAKGPAGWMAIDTANVYFDHPQAAPFDHALNIDFVNRKEGSPVRVAVELSAESALDLVEKVLAALDHGAAEHGEAPDLTRRVKALRAVPRE
ncbi:MAG: DUF6295 family protein [Vicinamibacterales bacterium]